MTNNACPICTGPTAADYRPFCSRRCANVDLQRWLTGRYALGEDHMSELDALWSQGASETPTES